MREINLPHPQAYQPGRTLKSVRDQFIISALSAHNGNVAQTARAIGISRKTIYYWAKQTGYNL